MTNKRIFLPYIVLAALFLPCAVNAAMPIACAATSPATKGDAVGQHLVAEEQASWDLAIKRDAANYKAFHAADFFTVTGTGVVDRTSSETSAMDPQARFDRCELSGFDVHFVAENAALVTYHVTAAGLDHGKAFKLDSYASSLWMKRDGKWLNVFYQATPSSHQ